jgi:hypothetical protein
MGLGQAYGWQYLDCRGTRRAETRCSIDVEGLRTHCGFRIYVVFSWEFCELGVLTHKLTVRILPMLRDDMPS